MSIVPSRKSTAELEKEIAELEASGVVEDEQKAEEDQTTELNEEKDTKPKSEKNDKTPDEETFKKRYGDLRRHSQARERELKEKIENLESKIENLEKNGGQRLRPLASDESVSEWKAKYPEIASIVETVADKIAEEKFNRARMDLDEIQEFRKESTKEKAIKQIRSYHSDFDDISESDDFHEWVDEQPKWVQDALFVNSDDALSVVRVLDLYKADKGLDTKSEKKRQKDSAKTVTTKSNPDISNETKKYKFSESMVNKMSAREYEKYAADIDESMRTGTFLYDISGGAR